MQDIEPGHPLHEHDYTKRLWSWLGKFNFQDHPFAVWEADRERAALPMLFVDRPYMSRLLGDPARPQSAFLLAGRGAGKTATREYVVNECVAGRLRRRALPIRYIDFTGVLEAAGGDPTRVTLRDHAVAIVRAGLRALSDDVPPALFAPLDGEQRQMLQTLAAAFADGKSVLRLARFAPAEPLTLNWDRFSPVELLELFADVVLQLGIEKRHYESVYVLVDRVDETAAGPEGAVALLRSLVVQGGALGSPHVAFKFFLPREIGEQLLAAADIRRDRYVVELIAWDEDALEHLLELRLRHYSNETVQDFAQLCTPNAAAIAPKLWRDCDESPRNLLRVCEGIVRLHVLRTYDQYLEPRDISAARTEFEQEQEAERNRPLVAARQAEAVRTGQAPAAGLYLDPDDHVWVDGRLLETPLSDLEFKLLKALYQATPAIVSQEELVTAVWRGADPANDGAIYEKDEQNVRKLVARLRDRLEPGVTSDWRFLRNARGRGYWLSVA